MLKGIYNQIKNGHALSALLQKADIPLASLGIGDAQNKGSLNIKFRPVPPVQAATIKDVKTMDDTLYVGKGAQVTPNQFPKSYYMGEE